MSNNYYCDLPTKQCKPATDIQYGQYVNQQYIFDSKEKCNDTCQSVSLNNCQEYVDTLIDFGSGSECAAAGNAPVCAPFVKGPGALDNQTGNGHGSQYRLLHSFGTGRCELLHKSHAYSQAVAQQGINAFADL